MWSDGGFVIFLVLGFLLACSFSPTSAYKMGDIVRFSKRSQLGNVLSEWSELTSANCPRFLYEKKVDLPLSLNAVDFYSEKGFKLSFALDNMRFLSPFIYLNNGVDTALKNINFVLIYSGDDIIDVRFVPEYQKARVIAKKPLSLRFTWEEYSEQHVTVGTGVLLFAGFLITYLLVGYSLLSFYLTLKPSLSVDQRLPTKLVSKSN